MADYVKLELKTFELSKRNSNLSLAMTSLAYIKDLPFSQTSSLDIHRLIQSKQLWLLSPGFCQLQIVVDQSQFPTTVLHTKFDFLDYLADAICQCSLWQALGLIIEKEDIHYHPEFENGPNLYFIVYHPDKSSALLSPPGTGTAHFTGLECMFRFRLGTPETRHGNSEGFNIDNADIPHFLSIDTSRETMLNSANHLPLNLRPSNSWNGSAEGSSKDETQEIWHDAAYLVQMAMHIAIGAKKRVRGLQLFELDTSPSLLDLAPAVWNAHYLKATAIHVSNFSVISKILAASVEGQSPSLRQKGAKLLGQDHPEDNQGVSTRSVADANDPRISIQRRLWDLLQETLMPTTHLRNGKIGNASLSRPSNVEILESVSLVEDRLEGSEYGKLNAAENIIRSDVNFDGAPDPDWRSHQLSEHETYDCNGQLNAMENQQWWGYETADMDIFDTNVSLQGRDIVEEIEYPRNDHEEGISDQYFPSPEIYDTFTFLNGTEPPSIYDDFSGDAMDSEDTYASGILST
ncbi:hypothetical protein F4779DRAFT_442223 [Xylariaceae sp. FL0662B]|nr:hypothetical protein F4779DRAFT_442223 [Xylariaceae sp. FL0662B]